MSTFELVIGICSGIILLMALIGIILILYACYKKLDAAEGLLENCAWVITNKSMYSNLGWVGKFFRFNCITIMLWIPSLCERRGLVNIIEVKNFPPRLRLLFLSPFWIGGFVLAFSLLILLAKKFYGGDSGE